MAQTEGMKRLLLKGKPVGFECHRENIIAHCEYLKEFENNIVLWDILEAEYDMITGKITHPNYIKHDSFELGIKTRHNRQWFSGDIGRDERETKPKFLLDFNGIQWTKTYLWESHESISRVVDADDLMGDNRIGNIHEESNNAPVDN